MDAIDNTRLLTELRFQLTVTRAMLGALELEQVLYIILSGITHGEGLNFNRAFLFLADEKARRLRASTAIGPPSAEDAHRIWEEIEAKQLTLENLLDSFEAAAADPRSQTLARRLAGLSMSLETEPQPFPEGACAVTLEQIVARCAVSRQPYSSNAVKAVFQPSEPGTEPMTFSHFACVPLLLKDSVLGVILVDNAYNGEPIQAEDLPGLATLGNLAAIAIEKAKLHKRLKEMASLDGLTQVFNRGHYDVRLQQEVGRARRVGLPLGLLMLDLDHFKQCNDNHGHECGDRVLKELAAFVQQQIRAEDLLARYGGEEFVILLTGGTTLEAARQVAEKLRALVALRSFGGLAPGEVTVSIGVASMPPDVVDGRALFRMADEAVYRAKRTGRNCVVVSDAAPALCPC